MRHMRNKIIGLTFSIIFLFASISVAAEIIRQYETPRGNTATVERIEVHKDRVGITVNGMKIENETWYHDDGITFVGLREVAEMLGADVDYNSKTMAADITLPNGNEQTSGNWKVTTLTKKIDPYTPIIDLTSLEITKNYISSLTLHQNGEQLPVEMHWENGVVSIPDDGVQNALHINETYSLQLITTGLAGYNINFQTSGLKLLVDTGQYHVYFVPAMPEKGFNFPYLISLPNDRYKRDNENKERYLLVEPNNFGKRSNDINDHIKDAVSGMKAQYPSYQLQEELWLPRMMPIFPRPELFHYGTEPYTHSLDSYSMDLENRFKTYFSQQQFKELMKDVDITADDIRNMYRIDQQLLAMVDHATSYLNQYDQKINEEQIFMYGFSASGDFTNRFTALHPERVKAVYSGAVNSTVIMPGANYKGENLVYPIGTSDHKKLIGKEFNLKAYNDVAKMMYIGAKDTNDTLGCSTCLEPEEQRLIKVLFGEKIYPDRWEATQKVFADLGGKGVFVTNLNAGHGGDIGDTTYMIDFFKANRDSNKPVYLKSKFDHVIANVIE